uniref:Uncharacterized protein n=1 Tax=viral metagenome TaxID=1070528 RepID=A0A6C0HU39_9ZZZZ
MTMTQSYWDLLPTELRSKVYEYDGTYKEIMKKNVFTELWKRSWIYHRDFIDSPYIRVVMDYLLNSWGVYEDKILENNWYTKNYFPHDFDYLTSSLYNNLNNIDDYKKVNVFIYRNGNCLFDGWVYNEEGQLERVHEDNRQEVDAIDVYWDMRTGLYVWRKLYW